MTQQAVKQVPCRGCGEPITVGIRTRIQPRCIMCGVREAHAAARQMHERSGPYYEKWVQSMATVAERFSRTTPGALTDPRGSSETCDIE
jgi:hypothetical protein